MKDKRNSEKGHNPSLIDYLKGVGTYETLGLMGVSTIALSGLKKKSKKAVPSTGASIELRMILEDVAGSADVSLDMLDSAVGKLAGFLQGTKKVAEISMMKICSGCGSRNPFHLAYCEECRLPLDVPGDVEEESEPDTPAKALIEDLNLLQKACNGVVEETLSEVEFKKVIEDFRNRIKDVEKEFETLREKISVDEKLMKIDKKLNYLKSCEESIDDFKQALDVIEGYSDDKDPAALIRGYKKAIAASMFISDISRLEKEIME